MELIYTIFGHGEELSMLQMVSRGVIVFIIALLLIRISGRRSFGIRTPLDNIISISLGAVMSRAIVGASPFLPVIATCFVIVILHRVIGLFMICNRKFGSLIEGDKILLFENGKFIKDQLRRALVCEEDVLQGIRKSVLTESLDEIERIYMERNGEITAIKKKSQ